jgi:hypothetical protein
LLSCTFAYRPYRDKKRENRELIKVREGVWKEERGRTNGTCGGRAPGCVYTGLLWWSLHNVVYDAATVACAQKLEQEVERKLTLVRV